MDFSTGKFEVGDLVSPEPLTGLEAACAADPMLVYRVRTSIDGVVNHHLAEIERLKGLPELPPLAEVTVGPPDGRSEGWNAHELVLYTIGTEPGAVPIGIENSTRILIRDSITPTDKHARVVPYRLTVGDLVGSGSGRVYLRDLEEAWHLHHFSPIPFEEAGLNWAYQQGHTLEPGDGVVVVTKPIGRYYYLKIVRDESQIWITNHYCRHDIEWDRAQSILLTRPAL